VAIDGEGDFRQSITNINVELNKFKSALKMVESQYAGNANGLEALRAKQDALNNVIAEQKAKLDMQNEGLENAQRAEAKWAARKDELTAKIRANEHELEKYSSSTNNYKAVQEALANNTEHLNRKMEELDAGYAAASKGVTKWQTDINRTQTELYKLDRELDNNKKYLEEAENSADGAAKSIDKFGNSTDKAAQQISGLAMALLAAGVKKSFEEIVQAMKACVDASIEFESAMAGVAKTTGLEGSGLAAMGDSLKELSTQIPVTAAELAHIAENAGQLGIANENILDFTRVMADLGVATNLSADEAASALAKFANVTKMSTDDYDRLGSVIVGLGNNFATTEADIVAMATRLASTGELVGLSEAEIMGFATALSSLGIEAEAGGSALSKLLRQFEVMVATGSNDLNKFARVAGMTAEQFSAVWGSEPTAALGAFIDGLGRLDASGGSVAATLDDLGIKEVRLSNAVSSMASSGDLLSRALEMANSAWAENVALTNEAATRYETTESKMQMLSNSFDNVKVAIGDQLAPALRSIIDAGTSVAQWAAEFIEQNEWLGPAITAVATALGVLAIELIALKMLPTITAMFHAFTAALAANPIFLVAAAIAGLVVGLVALSAQAEKTEVEILSDKLKKLGEEAEESAQKFKEARESIADNSANVTSLAAQLEELANKTERSAGETALMKTIIDRLNESVPDLGLSFNELTGSLSLTTDQVIALAAAERARAENQVNIDKFLDAQSRYNVILADQVNAERQAKEARAAYEQYAQSVRDSGAVNDDSIELNKLRDAAFGAEDVLKDLNAQLDTEEATMNSARAEIEKYTDATNEQTEATDGLTAAQESSEAQQIGLEEAQKAATKAAEEQKKKLDDLQKSTAELSKASGTLSGALAEQKRQGELSVDTVNSIIDAGYAAALQMDAETGAVTVNREAYVALAQAKIEERIASATIDRAALVSAIGSEALAAQGLAQAVSMAAMANIGLAETEFVLNAAQKEQVGAYDAQIAALEQLRQRIGKTTAAQVSGSGSSSKAAKTAAEAAEEAAKKEAKAKVDAYKKAKDELDHLRAMDVIDEAEYYKRLEELSREHLSGDDTAEDSRKVAEELYKYEKKAAEDATKAKVDAYKKAKDELDHLKAMDVIDEAEYYKRLDGLRGEYLAGDDTVEEFSKVAEELYKYQVQSLKDRFGSFTEHLQKLQKESDEALKSLKKDFEEVEKARQAMQSKLDSYGGLTEEYEVKVNGKTEKRKKLADISKQITALNEYNDTLKQLSGRGVPQALMAEIIGMGVDEATEYGKLLLASQAQFDAYIGAYQQKQDIAREIAGEYYKPDIDEAKANFDKLQEELLAQVEAAQEDYFATGEYAGTALADGMIEGLRAKEEALRREAEEMAQSLSDSIREALGIHSPSAVGRELMGHFGDGMALGFEEMAEDLRLLALRATPRMLVEPIESISPAQIARRQTEDTVNGLGTLMAGAQPAGGDLSVVVRVDSVDFARVILPAFRAVSRQSPEIAADF
jgi:TP901 family phage tail tape measure protein